MRPHNALRLLVGAAVAAAGVTPAQAQFGGLGGISGILKGAKTAKKVDDSMRTIGQPEEIAIGGDLAGMILGAAPLVENQAAQRYVNRVGTWLAMHTERADLPWRFGIIDTDSLNAFSTPGGYVLITRGLLEQFRNEAELAGVLAHEIAHVVQKHHLHALQNELRTSAIAEVGSSVASSQGGIAGFAAGQILQAGKIIYIRGLDKNDEYEADRMGVVIATRAGYSPYGLVGVLQTLSAEQESNGLALMNRTHPNPSDRIARLDEAMGSRFDDIVPLADDLPSFEALRTQTPQ